jgi:hypothetical protein
MSDFRFDVDEITGCWNWLGYVGKDGYGRQFKTKDRVSTLVHVNSFVRNKGPVPDGMEIDHVCRNRRCINPDHLRAITHKENVPKGEGVASAKLTAVQVIDIRKEYTEGGISQKGLATKYGVSQMAICRLVQGKNWATV